MNQMLFGHLQGTTLSASPSIKEKGEVFPQDPG